MRTEHSLASACHPQRRHHRLGLRVLEAATRELLEARLGPASFTLAALAGRDDVEITHAHLDRHDRPTLVFLLHGEDTTAVFLMAHEAGTHVMIKGTSMGALAPGLELLDGCFESTDRVA